MLLCTCTGHWIRFSPTVWVLGIELMLSGLAAGAFTPGVVLLAYYTQIHPTLSSPPLPSVCVCVSVCLCMRSGILGGQKRAPDPLQLKTVVGHPVPLQKQQCSYTLTPLSCPRFTFLRIQTWRWEAIFPVMISFYGFKKLSP